MLLQTISSWLGGRVQKETLVVTRLTVGAVKEAGMRATGCSSYMPPKDCLFCKAGRAPWHSEGHWVFVSAEATA